MVGPSFVWLCAYIDRLSWRCVQINWPDNGGLSLAQQFILFAFIVPPVSLDLIFICTFCSALSVCVRSCLCSFNVESYGFEFHLPSCHALSLCFWWTSFLLVAISTFADEPASWTPLDVVRFMKILIQTPSPVVMGVYWGSLRWELNPQLPRWKSIVLSRALSTPQAYMFRCDIYRGLHYSAVQMFNRARAVVFYSSVA